MDKKKVKKTTDEIEFVICIAILAVMLVASSYNVIARYALGKAQNWPDELCRFGLIWVSFLSMSAAVTSGNHLYVDLLTGVTEKHPRFAMLIQAISSVLWVALVWCWPTGAPVPSCALPK